MILTLQTLQTYMDKIFLCNGKSTVLNQSFSVHFQQSFHKKWQETAQHYTHILIQFHLILIIKKKNFNNSCKLLKQMTTRMKLIKSNSLTQWKEKSIQYTLLCTIPSTNFLTLLENIDGRLLKMIQQMKLHLESACISTELLEIIKIE